MQRRPFEFRVEGAAGLQFSQKPNPLGVRDAGEEPQAQELTHVQDHLGYNKDAIDH